MRPALPPAGESGVEVAGDVSVRRLRDVGVQLHAEPGRGMAEPVLDDSRMLAGVDQEAGRDMAEAMEGQLVGESRPSDSGVEHPGCEGTPQRAALGAREHKVVAAGSRSVQAQVLRKLVTCCSTVGPPPTRKCR